MIEKIIEGLIPSKDYIFGFAHLKGLLDVEFQDYPYGISIGKKLDDHIVDAIENGPTLEYYDHYREVNNEVGELSGKICEELTKEGVKCIPVVPTLPIGGEEFRPYLEKLRYSISHKMVATRAGLGWIGKSDLFISKEFGPRLRLVSILIDHPLTPAGKPIDKSRCGACRLCVVKCPAQASNGKLWNINTDRDEFFDAHKCREKCGELAKRMLNMEIRVCGICVAVCPIGKNIRQS